MRTAEVRKYKLFPARFPWRRSCRRCHERISLCPSSAGAASETAALPLVLAFFPRLPWAEWRSLAAAVTSELRFAGSVCQGKGKAAPHCPVVPLADFKLLRLLFLKFFRCKLIHQNFKGVLNRGVVCFLSQHLTGRVFFKKLIS